MTGVSPAIDKLVNRPADDFTASFFRWCLSDKLPIHLKEVTDGQDNPLAYAARLERAQGEIIADQFLARTRGVPKKYPSIITQAWVFDKLVGTAVFYRLMNIFGEQTDNVRRLFMLSNIYLLNTYDKRNPVSALAGLTDYTQHVWAYIQKYPDLFKSSDCVYLFKTLKAASSLDKPDWFLWNEKWHSVLYNPIKAVILRRFLQATFSICLQFKGNFEGCFNIRYGEMIGAMVEFVHLCETDATKAEVDSFIDRMQFHFDLKADHPELDLLLAGKFTDMKTFYLHRAPHILHPDLQSQTVRMH